MISLNKINRFLLFDTNTLTSQKFSCGNKKIGIHREKKMYI